MRGFLRRLRALTIKEFRQLFRDRSNLLLGIGLPIILIFIFGYGITFDITGIKLGVVNMNGSEISRRLVSGISGAPVFQVYRYNGVQEAERDFLNQKIEGYLVFRNDFDREYRKGDGKIQFIMDGKDPNRAQTAYMYLTSALGGTLSKEPGTPRAGIVAETRMWFNQPASSTWYIVPGLVVLSMTLVGTFLTALVMAREYERGTLEAIFVSPVRPVEIIIGKIIPYFCVGILGFALCLLAARELFDVPIRCSILLLSLVSMLYLVVALAIGLLISAITRNQFVASQLSVLVTFLPCIMLSGFIFDLRNTPEVIFYIGHILPSTYYMETLKTLFLAGDVHSVVLKNSLILTLYAVGFTGITMIITRKRLD